MISSSYKKGYAKVLFWFQMSQNENGIHWLWSLFFHPENMFKCNIFQRSNHKNGGGGCYPLCVVSNKQNNPGSSCSRVNTYHAGPVSNICVHIIDQICLNRAVTVSFEQVLQYDIKRKSSWASNIINNAILLWSCGKIRNLGEYC